MELDDEVEAGLVWGGDFTLDSRTNNLMAVSLAWGQWWAPVVSATQEAEARELLELRSLRLQRAPIVKPCLHQKYQK